MLEERKFVCDRLWEYAADSSVTDDSEGVKEKENETNYRDAKRPSFPEPGMGRECKNSEVDTEIGELTTYRLTLWSGY